VVLTLEVQWWLYVPDTKSSVFFSRSISEFITVFTVATISYLNCLHRRDFVTEYFNVVCEMRGEFFSVLYMYFSLQRVNGRAVEGGGFDIGAILVAW